MCTLIRRSRIEYGSEAASAEIKLEVVRSAKLQQEPKLQVIFEYPCRINAPGEQTKVVNRCGASWSNG